MRRDNETPGTKPVREGSAEMDCYWLLPFPPAHIEERHRQAKRHQPQARAQEPYITNQQMGNRFSRVECDWPTRRGYEALSPGSPSLSHPMTIEVNQTESRFISEAAGNGLIAKHNLKPGDVILRIKDPYVLIPRNSVLPKVCYSCHLEKSTLSACSGCKSVKYCSKACQKISWKDIHSRECKIFRKCKDDGHPVLPTPVRALIQALLRHVGGIDPDPGWSQLSTHKESFMKQDEAWEDVKLQAWAALKYVGSSENMMDLATSMLCAFKVNAFDATQPDGTPIGLCFDPLFAMANHSCLANTQISFDGRYASFKALQPIQEGAEITIYYVDTNQPLAIRQSQLRERYRFTCVCPKCVKDWDTYTSFLHHPCLPANQNCMFSNFDDVIKKAIAATGIKICEVGQNYDSIHGAVNRANERENPAARYRGLRLAMDMLDKAHRGQIIAAAPYPIILRSLVENYVDADEIEAALILLLATAFHVQPFEFPEPWNPIRIATLRSVTTLISEILADPKYSLTRLRAIPDSQAANVDLLGCDCVLLLTIRLYGSIMHGASSKLLEDVNRDLADIQVYAKDLQHRECLEMLASGIRQGNGLAISRRYFRELELLADIELMHQVLDTVDCKGNGHNRVLEAF